MTVRENILYVACGNDDDQLQIVARSATGRFQTLLTSGHYKNISAFVTRGNDLYAFGAKVEGGGMVLKFLKPESAP